MTLGRVTMPVEGLGEAIYTCEGGKPRLIFYAEDRTAWLALSPHSTEGQGQLKLLGYALNTDREIDQPLGHFAPEMPMMCPCCVQAGRDRVERMDQHVLTSALAASATHECPLDFTLSRTDWQLHGERVVQGLRAEKEWLVLEETSSLLLINMAPLHALVLKERGTGDEKVAKMVLFNSHGESFLTIEGGFDRVGQIWFRSIRDNPSLNPGELQCGQGVFEE